AAAWFAADLYGAFSVKRLFWVCCQFFVRSGKAVLRPVACDQVPGARGRGQGTETLAQLGGLPPPAFAGAGFSVARVWQRPRPSLGQALTPEHAEGRWTARRAFLEAAPTSD